MQGVSRTVTSSQRGPHQNLRAVVNRQRGSRFERPIAEHNLRAFEQVARWIDPNRRLIVDAGCGTGESTMNLAKLHHDCQVIGIDRSAQRLVRFCGDELALKRENVILLRADLVDWLRLAISADWHCHKLYLLYPNPWPKPGQLQRRWHAHPVFPVMLELADELEMRTNWRLYAEEFVIALAEFGLRSAVESYDPQPALTPFEQKYLASGHQLFRTVCRTATQS